MDIYKFAALIIFVSLSVNLLPVHAQEDLPKQALNRLMYAYGMEAVDGLQKFDYPGYAVDMRAPQSAEVTNSAIVIDVSSDYGNNGGETWARANQSQWSDCAPTEESFHGLYAYSLLCRRNNGYIEGFVWGMDNWGLATFNYLETPSAPAADLAEYLYQIMLDLTGSPAKQPPTITPTVTKPAAQPGNPQSQSGTWTQTDITRMAVTVLTEFSKQVHGFLPEVIYTPADYNEKPPTPFIKFSMYPFRISGR